jgi:transposase
LHPCISGAKPDNRGAALAPKPTPGRPRRLTDQQCTQLVELLLQGATAPGFANELRTLRRIAAVIQVACGVHDHPAHVWKLLRRLGWSCQLPEGRAIQRDEQAMAHWQRSKWPAIQKSPTTWGPPRLPG